jgi:biopolymer transport protein TolR
MGMAAGHGAQAKSGRRRRHGARRRAGFADINMTPFIDVMLVLLIVFMVAAPLLTSGVPLDLPQTSAKPLNVDQKPITLSIDERGRIFLQEAELKEDEIVPRLQAVAKAGTEERIYVRGAKKVDYGRVAQVMSVITSAGFKKVALITEPDQKS